MRKRGNKKWREPRRQAVRQNDLSTLLDSLLQLDQKVVELSLRTYRIAPRDRFSIRKQQRRLHEALRQRLPYQEA